MKARRIARNAQPGAGRMNAAELIAALMKRPSTRKQLQQATGVSIQAVDQWLIALHASGVIRLQGYVEKHVNENGERARGDPPRIWAFQATPFAEPDFERRAKSRKGD